MKKLIVFVLALSLVLAMAACSGGGETQKPQDGGNTPSNNTPLHRDDEEPAAPAPGTNPAPDPTPQTQPPENPPAGSGISGAVTEDPLTLTKVMMYIESGNEEYFKPHRLTAKEEQELRASVEAEGGKLTVNADGSITITGKAPSVMTIGLDGSVTGTDEDGQPINNKIGGPWPQTELGKAVPTPPFKLAMSTEDEEDGLLAMFKDADRTAVKAYAQTLKEAGFTERVEEMDLAAMDMYTFEAVKGGCKVELMYMGGEEGASAIINVYHYTPDPEDPYEPGGDPGFDPNSSSGGEDEPFDPNSSSAGEDPYDPFENEPLPEVPQVKADEWPTAAGASRLPKPTFGTGFSTRADQWTITVTVQGAKVSDFDTYMAAMREKGFTRHAEMEDEDDVKFYQASDKDDYAAYVQWAYGSLVIGVTNEPDAEEE